MFQAFIGKEVPLPTPGRILTYLTAAPLSASRLAVAYADANEGNVLLVDVAGGVAMPQSPVPFSSNKPLSLSMASLSEDSFILTFYSKSSPSQFPALPAHPSLPLGERS